MDRRVLRAIVLMALAIAVIAAAGAAYVRPPAAAPLAVEIARAVPSMVTIEPVDYYFSTPVQGWAVENPTPATDFGVFRTADGAQHWREVLELDAGLTEFVEPSVQFPDAKHGFVAVGGHLQRLTRTIDGGEHWQSLALPPASVRVEGISFSDSTHGFLFVGGNGRRLYVTQDAGDTWRRLPDPPADAEAVIMRGPKEAWMGTVGSGTPHVYQSADGGMSWARRDLSPPSGPAWDGGIPSRVELLPGGGVEVLVAGRGNTLIFTGNANAAGWTYVPAPPGVPAFEDSSRWWAMSRSMLFKSGDGGQTWTLVTNRLPDWRFVPHVIDSRHAWAAITVGTGSGLAITSDGGVHWSRAPVPSASY